VITLLADKNIPFLSDLLPDGVSLKLFDPDLGLPSFDASVDALFIRTVTPIRAKTFDLAQFPNIKCIGSASAGIDHVDTDFLSNLGISFFYAAGCNATAVAEYVTTGIMEWASSKNLDQTKLTVGVVGVGHTGKATSELLRLVGFNIMLNDPPRELVDPGFTGVSTSDILDADILTFHVPLVVDETDFPTHHWLDTDCISRMRAKLVVNASRGGVVDESALVNVRSTNRHIDFILDVWENEPKINPIVLKSSYLGTPHIAGYSQQSKLNGTSMIVRDLKRFFSLGNDINATQTPVMIDSWSPKGDTSINQTEHDSIEQSRKLRSEIAETEENQTGIRALDPDIDVSAKLKCGINEVSVDQTGIRALDPDIDVSAKLKCGINKVSVDQTGIRALHPMFELSEKLKSGISESADENVTLFRNLRVHSSLRNEYRYLSPDDCRIDSPIRHLFKGSGK
jgi:erythronate-4-phosphate dehydrogenase